MASRVPRALMAALVACTLLGLDSTATGQANPPEIVSASVHRRLAETAGPVKVWVFFRDKGFANDSARVAALSELAADFPTRAAARRSLRRTSPGLVDNHDLPVAERYVTALLELGADVHVRSRWLNAVSATVEPGMLAPLADLPFVESIRLVNRSAPRATLMLTPAGSSGGGDGEPAPYYGYAIDQTEQLNMVGVHDLGFTGAGVVIGVLDTGFDLSHEVYNFPGHEIDVITSWDFVNDDADVGIEAGDPEDQHRHGTIVLATIAGYNPDTFVGLATDASFILAKTEIVDEEIQAEEDQYVAGLEFVELNGADIATASLGYIDWYTQADLDGETAVTTIAVNIATSNGMYCVAAAGNEGNDTDPTTSTIIAPADAFEVITVGAVGFDGELASFSSDGPTADGRTKPEVLAMGDPAVTISSSSPDVYVYAGGTSLATPLIAGMMACLIQAHPEWSVSIMRARLIDKADYFGSPKPDPLHAYGYGIANALESLNSVGTWVDLENGLAGTSGIPALVGSGTLIEGDPISLSMTDARPNALSWLVVGMVTVNLPFYGGTLVPGFQAPEGLFVALPTTGTGTLDVGGTWPAAVPPGFSLYVQVWIDDPAAIFGVAGSNAVSGTTP